MGPSIPAVWEIIGKVTSGFTLLALIIVVILYIYKINSEARSKILKSSTGEDQIKLIQTLSEIYDIPVKGLSQRQQYSIVMEQLKQRKQKYLLKITSLAAFMVMFFVATIVSIYKYNTTSSQPAPTPIKQEKQALAYSDTVSINIGNTPIIKPAPENAKALPQKSTATVTKTLVEPKTIDEYITAIKSSKDPVLRSALRSKARVLLAPQFDFGEIHIKTDKQYDKVIATYKFINYDPVKNVLKFHQNYQSFTENFDNLYVEIEGDVSIELNKVLYIDKLENDVFSISCNSKKYSTCVSYNIERGSCPSWVKSSFPQCLAETTHNLDVPFYIFYDDSGAGKLQKLHSALRTEIEDISGLTLK
ncbi:hypothetical protein HA50_24775 [Pantoea cypripedii]|uniref:Uncharacterized protein n=2 Tax=Pantoea cypripedii TaxID=55209 RepID=A0A1X1ELQ4_PANCY|nr:hypothetical protein HA50_24775 [Pantoea cypripedii]